MELLRTLLLNYKIPGVRQSEVRRICSQELSKLLECDIPVEKIQFKNDILLVSVSPLLKSAIYIKQDALTRVLAESQIVLKGIR